VTAHRVLFKDEYDSLDREEIIRTILEEVPVPA
jgi:hypothetical protein